jgi:hypothetical protein
VRALGLKNAKEWLDYCKSGKRPLNIPANPQKAYASKSWTNSGDWLGTGNTKNSSLPFEEARAFVRGLGLKGGTEWKAYCKSGKKPVNIPSNPSTVYAGKGWTNFIDWLGTNNAKNGSISYLPYDYAHAFVRPLGLKSAREWSAYCASGERPANIPATPDKVYAGKGWTNWRDWLGTGPKTTTGDEHYGGHRASKLVPHREFLEAARAEKSDVTLRTLCDRLSAERGVKPTPQR